MKYWPVMNAARLAVQLGWAWWFVKPQTASASGTKRSEIGRHWP
jgi:hypothetical protein